MAPYAKMPMSSLQHFKTKKNVYIIYIWSGKAFKSTLVNQAMPYSQEGSLEITFRVPFNSFKVQYINSICAIILQIRYIDLKQQIFLKVLFKLVKN